MYGEAGLEFKMPIHRVMSSKDEYGKNDDTGAGLLTFGLSRDKRRAYKCALREIEGAYEKGKEPTTKGLAEAKDFGKKKRKADEEAPEDIKAVPAEEMAALVFKMKTYAGAALLCPGIDPAYSPSRRGRPPTSRLCLRGTFTQLTCGTALALRPS